MEYPQMQDPCTNGTGIILNGTGPSWRQYDAVPQSAGMARRHTVLRLTHGIPHSSSALIENAESIVSELVTNSVQHAEKVGPPPKNVAPGIWLGIQITETHVHIHVRDPYPTPPKHCMAMTGDEHGRGIAICSIYSDALWTETTEWDKTVHAILTHDGIILTNNEMEGLR